MSISTHVLDTAAGRPASGVELTLSIQVDDGSFRAIKSGVTDQDGRVAGLVGAGESLEAGVYRVRFDLAAYHARQGVEGFYPYACIVFHLRRPEEHHHIPLLLSPFGYTTYRGS